MDREDLKKQLERAEKRHKEIMDIGAFYIISSVGTSREEWDKLAKEREEVEKFIEGTKKKLDWKY